MVQAGKITGDTHPDHDTIGTFRRENKALVAGSFVKIPHLAQELKLARFGQVTVSSDGTGFEPSYNAQAGRGRRGANPCISRRPGRGKWW